MDERAIGAGSLADAGLRRLASEMDGPRPAGVERGTVARIVAAEAASTASDARRLRPTRP
jgi:hypothetical protein